jgi:predicted small secreted protein
MRHLSYYCCVALVICAVHLRAQDVASSRTTTLRDDAAVVNSVIKYMMNDKGSMMAFIPDPDSGLLYYLPYYIDTLTTTRILYLHSDEDFQKLSSEQTKGIMLAAADLAQRNAAGDQLDGFAPQDKRLKLYPRSGPKDEVPGYGTGNSVLQIAAPGYAPDGNISAVFIAYYGMHHSYSNLFYLRRTGGKWSVFLTGFERTL